MRMALALLALGLLAAGCTAPLEGATQCPCAEGWSCDLELNICRPHDAGVLGDADFSPADATTTQADAFSSGVSDSGFESPDSDIGDSDGSPDAL